MCLQTVDEKTRHISKGYKVVWKHESFPGSYTPEYKGFKHLEKDRWAEEEDYRARSQGDTILVPKEYLGVSTNGAVTLYPPVEYPTGFHVFTSKESARYWRGKPHTLRIVKVEVAGCVASGFQQTFEAGRYRTLPVVVAKRIKLVREV